MCGNCSDGSYPYYGVGPHICFYKWTIDLNDQWVYLEERIHRAGIDFTVTRVRQNCDNMHVTIDGDPDQVAWMDMALLVWSNNKRCKHLLVLEHKG